MSVLDRPRTEYVQPTFEPAELPAAPTVQWKPTEVHRWFLYIGVPFVLGAFFFGLALALDSTWPMVPMFFLGPFLMIAAYIYLCLSSEANSC